MCFISKWYKMYKNLIFKHFSIVHWLLVGLKIMSLVDSFGKRISRWRARVLFASRFRSRSEKLATERVIHKNLQPSVMALRER